LPHLGSRGWPGGVARLLTFFDDEIDLTLSMSAVREHVLKHGAAQVPSAVKHC